MSKLPKVSGLECVKALKKLGFYVRRQQGSHIILRRNQPLTQVVVPAHKEIHKGTLRNIIKQVGLTVDELIDLL